MSVNVATKEDSYWKKFEPSLSWSDFIEKPQEGTDSVPQIQTPDTEIQLNTDTIVEAEIITDSLVSQNPYPYIILPEDSSAISFPVPDYLSNWQINFDFNEYFLNQLLSKKTLSIKEVYPGEEGIPIHRGIQTEIWFTPLLFLLFVSYGLVFLRKKKILFQDMKEFFTLSFRNETFREDFYADNFQSRILLVITGIVNISLFSFFTINHILHYEAKNFILILFLLLVVTILYVLFKTAMIKLICYVFFDKNLSSSWTKTFHSFILFLGIFLIPIVLCLSFGPTTWITSVVYIGLFFYICLSIFYLSKITTFFFRDTSSLFYLILYLCSLEILPALIFLGGLINVITNNGIIVVR